MTPNRNITVECTFSNPIRVSDNSELNYLYERGGFFTWIGGKSDVIKAMLIDFRNSKVVNNSKITNIYIKVQLDLNAFNSVDGLDDSYSITDFKEYLLEIFSDDIKRIAIDEYLVYSLEIEDVENTPLKLI